MSIDDSQELERRAASMYARSLLEASLDPLVAISPEGKITYVNAATEEATGRDRRELVGADFTECFTEPEKARESYQNVLANGLTRDYPLTIRHASGRTTDVLYNASLFRDEAGAVQGVFAAARDVTERRKAKEAIAAANAEVRRAGELLQEIIDNIRDLIATLDTSFCFLAFNDAYAREFKTVFGRDIAIGDSLVDKLAHLPQDQANAVDIWGRALHGEEFQVVQEFGDSALQRKTFEITYFCLRDKHGAVAGATHVVRDISERVRAERTLAKSSDLERSNRDLEQFAYVASHDLQEPLRMVSSYTQLLAERYRDKLDQDANDFIGFAVDGANRMQRLISDLLTYSRVGTRAKPLDAVDSHAAFGRAVANLRAKVQQIARIGSWILYPESGELRASAEMFRIFALDPLPVAPVQLFLERVHEEDRAGVAAGIAASLQTGSFDLEFRIVTPQRTRVAHAVARKREAGESRLSLIGTTQDITEWKAAEETLRKHNESLEGSNAELERFNRLAVGRELRMIELKRQINDLCAQSGQPVLYVLPEERALARETS